MSDKQSLPKTGPPADEENQDEQQPSRPPFPGPTFNSLRSAPHARARGSERGFPRGLVRPAAVPQLTGTNTMLQTPSHWITGNTGLRQPRPPRFCGNPNRGQAVVRGRGYPPAAAGVNRGGRGGRLPRPNSSTAGTVVDKRNLIPCVFYPAGVCMMLECPYLHDQGLAAAAQNRNMTEQSMPRSSRSFGVQVDEVFNVQEDFEMDADTQYSAIRKSKF